MISSSSSKEWPIPNAMASPQSARPEPITSGNTLGPTGWPGTGGRSQPPKAGGAPKPTRNNPGTPSGGRMNEPLSLRETGGLHRVAHLGIALAHEFSELGGIAPYRAKT